MSALIHRSALVVTLHKVGLFAQEGEKATRAAASARCGSESAALLTHAGAQNLSRKPIWLLSSPFLQNANVIIDE